MFFLPNITGIEIAEFKGYELGLKATKDFKEGSLILTVPSKVMLTEKNAKESELASFINIDPLLQNMPNITLALFLLLEKYNPGKHNIVKLYVIRYKSDKLDVWHSLHCAAFCGCKYHPEQLFV